MSLFWLCLPCRDWAGPSYWWHPTLKVGYALSIVQWRSLSVLVSPPVVPGPMARDGSGRPETLAISCHSPSLLPLWSVWQPRCSPLSCLLLLVSGFFPRASVYPDSSLLDLRLQNFLFPPPKCSYSETCHSLIFFFSYHGDKWLINISCQCLLRANSCQNQLHIFTGLWVMCLRHETVVQRRNEDIITYRKGGFYCSGLLMG